MSFTQLVFLFFLPAVFALHFLRASRTWQNGVLLVASYMFYGWWDIRFCGLMLAASLIDYAAGHAIHRQTRPFRRRLILVLSLSANLGMLGFFKYCNFFLDSLTVLLALAGLDVNTTTFSVVLPVGISFYTFQTMSYTIDIYRGRLVPRNDWLAYLTFVSFFPQLVAGPIERAGHLLPQFESPRRFDPAAAAEGVRFILWGLFKKLVVADNLALLVEAPYGTPAAAKPASLALATVAFAFQIYCDFSAYSEIAAGTARLFGVQLVRNFAYPYFSRDPIEFWRRWHISLSTWFRDYVYIPLGGNRGSVARVTLTLLVTLLLSGLWHGAAWNFVVWGGLNGLLLAGTRLLPTRLQTGRPETGGTGDGETPTASALPRIALTFGLIMITWVVFRAASLGDAWLVYSRVGEGLLQPQFYSDLASLIGGYAVELGLLAGLIACEWTGRRHWIPLQAVAGGRAVRWALYTALFWVILIFGATRTQEFIYFQF